MCCFIIITKYLISLQILFYLLLPHIIDTIIANAIIGQKPGPIKNVINPSP